MSASGRTFGSALLLSLLLHAAVYFLMDKSRWGRTDLSHTPLPNLSVSFLPEPLLPPELPVLEKTEMPSVPVVREPAGSVEDPSVPEAGEETGVPDSQESYQASLESSTEQTQTKESVSGTFSEEVSGETSRPLPHEESTPSLSASENQYNGENLDSFSFTRARMPKPIYPEPARRLEWEGDVIISFTINAKGKVESLTVEESSGYELLDRSVVDTVRRGWRFPRREEPLRVWKTFSFRLVG